MDQKKATKTGHHNHHHHHKQANKAIELEELLNATDVIHLDDAKGEYLTVNGEKGVWLNKPASDNWSGLALDKYPINVDQEPQLIHKKLAKPIEYEQQIHVSYLRPATPLVSSDIVIQEEEPIPGKEAPPIIIRQVAEKNADKLEPLYYREAPPQEPKKVDPLVIKIPGKVLPPPPRKVIIEKMPNIPSKPRQIFLERWLTPKSVKRRVIFEKAPAVQTPPADAKPEVIINKKYYYVDEKDFEPERIKQVKEQAKKKPKSVSLRNSYEAKPAASNKAGFNAYAPINYALANTNSFIKAL